MSISNEDIKADWELGDTIAISMELATATGPTPTGPTGTALTGTAPTVMRPTATVATPTVATAEPTR